MKKKPRTINLMKPVKARKLPIVEGRCRVCGCTQDRACGVGCSWMEATHTLCDHCCAALWGVPNLPPEVAMSRAAEICEAWERSEIHLHDFAFVRIVLKWRWEEPKHKGSQPAACIYALVSRRRDDPPIGDVKAVRGFVEGWTKGFKAFLSSRRSAEVEKRYAL